MNISSLIKTIVKTAFTLVTKTALFNGLVAQETQYVQFSNKSNQEKQPELCCPCC